MCGICGAVSYKTPQAMSRQNLEAMAATLVHRGPDQGGVYQSSPSDFEGLAHVGLAHRRLSIIDLETGIQPLYDETKTIITVVNGEIYNYPQLRKDLLSRGHRLATRSDCESVVHLYQDYGPAFVDHLVGMFALALWDRERQRLVLARDRMGQKPLYYYHNEDLLIFGSELKALLAHPMVPRELSAHAFSKYLAYEYVPSPETIFKDIFKLEAGQILIWEKGEIKKDYYWDLQISENDHRISEKESLDNLEHLFAQGVERRLLSDVEVGVFLSGGLDSSLVALSAQKHYHRPMQAFTIGFEDKSFDETDYAREVAEMAGMRFVHEKLTENKFLDVIYKIADIIDEPFADPSIVPTYLLSRLAAQHVKVVLSGDGGDDTLFGYVPYKALKLVNLYKILPTSMRTRINKIVEYLPVRHGYLSLDFKLKQFMRGAGFSSEIMFFRWMGSFTHKEIDALLLPETKQAAGKFFLYEDILQHINRSHLSRDLERILYSMIKLYLGDDILVKVDRSSMANSLEVRSPFLDHQLVEFINDMPSHLKLRHLTTKYLLKKLGERHLPKSIVHRKKKGFGIPLGRWFRDKLKDFLTDYLAADRIKRQGLLNHTMVTTLVEDHLKGRRNNHKQLWTLLVFQLWLERWLSPHSSETIIPRIEQQEPYTG